MDGKKQPEFYSNPTAPAAVDQSMQMSAASGYPPQYAPGMPPPSYNEALSHPVANQGAYYYNQQPASAGAAGYAPNVPYCYSPQMYAPQPSHVPINPGGKMAQVPVYPVHQVTVAPGAFDAGARFNAGSQVRIPPPPPGIAPNAAQIAAASGKTVVVSQKKGSWLSGGSSGGYTFW